MIANDRAELVERLREIAKGEEPYQPAVGHDDRGPVWIFSGQGSQWASMGVGLLATEPVFAAKIAEIEPLIAAESGFSITEAITASETVEGIHKVQPAIFAMQVAMAATMNAYGVQPGAVIGHSLGEVAAAVVSGALSLEDGVKVICRRSLLCLRLAGGGAMASVELPAQQVREELEKQGIEDVVVAVVASPNSTVIGGATQTVRDIVAAWEQREIMAREVNVDVASHSPQVEPILDELSEMLADVTPMTPEIPYYSATAFDPREQPYCDADYWVENLRHTVRFSAAVQTALEDGFRVFGELSPHPLLTRPIDQTAAALDITVAALAGMRRGQEVPHGLGEFLGNLYAAGAEVDFSVLLPAGELVDAPLPTWTHRSLVLTPDADQQSRGAHLVAAHPLLGSHVRLLEEPERHAWQAEVGTAALPWLADHQINNVAALPGAAYCEMALAAARTALGDASEVRDVRFERMMLLKDETPVNAVAAVQSPGVLEFVVETDQDGERERRASAVLHAAEADDAAGLRHGRAARVPPGPRRRRSRSYVVRRSWCAVRPGVHRSGRRQRRRRRSRHGPCRDRPADRDPHPADRLRRASGPAGRLLPVGRRPSGRAGLRYRRPPAAARHPPTAGARPDPQCAVLPDPDHLARRILGRGRHRSARRLRHKPALRAGPAHGQWHVGGSRGRSRAERAPACHRVASAAARRGDPPEPRRPGWSSAPRTSWICWLPR